MLIPNTNEHFNVDERGYITDPGRFEREPLYTPYFWEFFLNGCGEEDYGELVFTIDEQDRAAFPQYPELREHTHVVLWQGEAGFIYCQAFTKE